MKISKLPIADALSDEDLLPVVQDGETKKAKRKDILVQSDMNVNDESNPAFIKNRTHWKEETEVDYLVLPYLEPIPGLGLAPYGKKIGLELGETYTIEVETPTGELVTFTATATELPKSVFGIEVPGVVFLYQQDFNLQILDGIDGDITKSEIYLADNCYYNFPEDLQDYKIKIRDISGTDIIIHKIPKEYYDIPEVDQVFNPKSSNPQAGIAIEEKFNTDFVPYLDKTTFEVLCDTVLTDAVASITIDKKSNGEALRCRRFIVFLTVPSNHDWSEDIGVNLSAYYNVISKVSMVQNRAPYLKAEENKPFYLEGYFEIFPTGSFSSLVGSTTDGDGHDNIYPIEIPLHSIISPKSTFSYYEGHTGKIVIEAPTGETFPSGTEIKIWGECL